MRTAWGMLCTLIIIAGVFSPISAKSQRSDPDGLPSAMMERIDMVASLGVVYATALRKCRDDLESKTLSVYEGEWVERLAERTYVFVEKKLTPSLKRFIAMDRGDIPANIDALYAQMLVNLDEQKRLMREWCRLSRRKT